MFKYKNHLSFYELINLINYAIDLRFSSSIGEYNDIITHNGYDNLTPILFDINIDDDYYYQARLSIFKNNFLKTKNNTLDTKIETLRDFLNVDNNIIKIPSHLAGNDKLVLYDKYNYDKFLYYKRYSGDSVFYQTYMNNNIENFETTCEIGNLNYNYIIFLTDLLYTICEPGFNINDLEDLTMPINYITNHTIYEGFRINFRYTVYNNLSLINNIKDINLPIDFINEATQIIIQNSKKLDILLNDIIAYLTSTSELFNVYMNEITTDTETTTNESSITDNHNKTISPTTKNIIGDKNNTNNINTINKTVDYIINDNNDIDNINNLKKNKYADKLVYHDDTINNFNYDTYQEEMTESEKVTNESFNRNVDDNKTKTNNSTFKRYKGIDIDIKTYQEIIKEVINIPNKMYDFLRLGVS